MLDVNVGWKKWAMITSFSHFHFNDLRMGTNGPDDYLRPNYVQRQDSMDVVITNPDPLVQTADRLCTDQPDAEDQVCTK